MPAPKSEKPEKTTKPRKAPAKKKTAAAPEPVVIRPSHDQIAALAQKFWAERGYVDGHAEQDWLRAEQELMQIAS
jgi:ABC-type uncharacterized transport system auxiliary subunit